MANEIPFYTYEKEPRLILKLQKGDAFPERPEPNSPDAIDDELWALMMSCWNYNPGLRPTCHGVRDGLTKLGICRSGDATEAGVGSNYAFWEAVREQSNIEVDYDAVEKILLGVSDLLQLRNCHTTTVMPLSFLDPRIMLGHEASSDTPVLSFKPSPVH